MLNDLTFWTFSMPFSFCALNIPILRVYSMSLDGATLYIVVRNPRHHSLESQPFLSVHQTLVASSSLALLGLGYPQSWTGYDQRIQILWSCPTHSKFQS
jgi:hypothetical protein